MCVRMYVCTCMHTHLALVKVVYYVPVQSLLPLRAGLALVLSLLLLHVAGPLQQLSVQEEGEGSLHKVTIGPVEVCQPIDVPG